MQFIFKIFFTFTLLFCCSISLSFGNTSPTSGYDQRRKCKYYSTNVANQGKSDPEECGKDVSFCFSLWRVSTISTTSQQSHPHSHGQNQSEIEGAVDEGSSVTKNYNSTVEFIEQGCWEVSPKTDCDNRNCTSIIRNGPGLGSGSAGSGPSEQFFCCCQGDYCNSVVGLVPKGEDDEDYEDERDGRLAGHGHGLIDHDDLDEAHSRSIRWIFMLLILVAVVFGICLIFVMIFYWIRTKQSIKGKDEEMIEVEEKLIGGCGGPGFTGVIIRDGNDDKSWQLSKDETIVLGNEIAKGKYATVFNGRVGGSNVALKIFGSEHKDVYKNEKWILECITKFKSERLIKYHGWQELIGSSGPEMIIVLDRIYPGSLRDYLCSENLNLNLEQCLKITCGIVEGISVLHGCNSDGVVIAHRDLTTKNILIDTELNTYIADYGLSLKTHGSKYTFGNADNGGGCIEKQAETSNLCEAGTLRYMAPELLEGAVNLKDCENSLKQIDIYSVAVIIWEIINLCGDIVLNVGHKLPFHELGKEITMESLTRAVVLRRQRPTFTNWRDHLISRQIRETILDSWDSEPEARLTSLCILERLHEITLITSTNSSLLIALKASEEPLESNCLDDDDKWTSQNTNLERNLLFGKNGDDSASSTQYLVTMSDKHRLANQLSSSTASSNNPNSANNIVNHNNHHNNLHHHHNNLLHHGGHSHGHHHHRHHHPNADQSNSTDGGESMTTLNTELSSASLTNFVQNVLL